MTRATGRARRPLARFQKRHNLDITARYFGLHGMGVGGHDRVRRRDVHHCENARLQKDAACIAGRHCRRCDFWRASSRSRPSLTCCAHLTTRRPGKYDSEGFGRREMLSISVALVLVTLISPAHADEQNAAVQTGTVPIDNPPLPRPKPLLLDATSDNPAMLISAFRHQHGEDSVIISADLTRIAQDQANAMARLDLLDHNALAPFASRMGRSGLSRAAENIAYGYADFPSTLKQWINSAGHRANLLLHGAKWIGVAHAQNGHRVYWAMVIGAK